MSIKQQPRINDIAPLSFEGVRARIEMGGVSIKTEKGFMLPDEATALYEWLGKALAKPVCTNHRWFHTGGGHYRCATCRVPRETA